MMEVAADHSGIAVVIVNWNSWQFTLACLASLRASVGIDWHCYVVDNASTDASRSHLLDLGAKVTVILSPLNGGWTGGNNLAVRRALDDGHEHVFILNNDARVEPGTMAELLRFHRADGSNPILGPLHLDDDGVAPEFVGATVNERTGLADITSVADVQIGSLPLSYPTAFIKGAGIFATRAHFERLGLFDDEFYLNFDDTDWAFRARAAGFRLLMLRSARIIHGGSGSIGGAYSPLNVYFLARNELLFAERHCRWSQRPRQLMSFLRRGNRLIGYPSRIQRSFGLFFGRTTLARAWRAGVHDYLLRRFGDCPAAIRRMRV